MIDPAMGAVRYEFVDFKIMCTLARDHDVIKEGMKRRKSLQVSEGLMGLLQVNGALKFKSSQMDYFNLDGVN